MYVALIAITGEEVRMVEDVAESEGEASSEIDLVMGRVPETFRWRCCVCGSESVSEVGCVCGSESVSEVGGEATAVVV